MFVLREGRLALLAAAPFDVVLVDEAAQVHQLHAVAACLRAARFVLVGETPTSWLLWSDRPLGGSTARPSRSSSAWHQSIRRRSRRSERARMNAPVMDLCNVVLHDGDRSVVGHAHGAVCGSDGRRQGSLSSE